MLWSAGTTPVLRWLDGTSTGARLTIQPFEGGAPSISIALLRDDPRFSHVVEAEPKFHGINR